MNLVLFFTRNVSLEEWVARGLFDREKLLYEEHLRRGECARVVWLTYGREDARTAARLKAEGCLHPDIEVLPPPRLLAGGLRRFLYTFLMPLIHRDALRDADVLKTNQIDGCWSALIAGRLFGKPVVVRSGYTPSLLAEAEATPARRKWLYRFAESLACRFADALIVSAEPDRQYVERAHPAARARLHVVPNYVDTRRFQPGGGRREPEDLVFVGRLTGVKNLLPLVRAVGKTGNPLVLYGEGELRDAVRRTANTSGASVRLMGAVPNFQLPGILNRYRYFVLPSAHEGMPKALIEAMACGLVCIGADIPGIRAIIRDGENGYLADGADPDALAAAIRRATRAAWEPVSAAAVETARARFSLQGAADRHHAVLQKALGR